MRNASDGTSTLSDGRNGSCRVIEMDLVSLIERVQASMRLIEAVMARELSFGNQQVAANIVVLDDVTPCCAEANAALNACQASLGTALHFLRDSGIAGWRNMEPARSDKAGGRMPIQSGGMRLRTQKRILRRRGA